jgi:hypothetical protein
VRARTGRTGRTGRKAACVCSVGVARRTCAYGAAARVGGMAPEARVRLPPAQRALSAARLCTRPCVSRVRREVGRRIACHARGERVLGEQYGERGGCRLAGGNGGARAQRGSARELRRARRGREDKERASI